MRRVSLLSLFTLLSALPLLIPLSARAERESLERVAVLKLENKAGVNEDELSYLTDLLRQSAGKLPKEHYLVMTKDNILVMLPPGKSLADCDGSCAVDTGRRLGAHWVLVGEVVRFGPSLRVSLNLHHTASGALRGSDVIKGKTLTELEGPLQRSALSLFSAIDARVGRSASFARALAELEGTRKAKKSTDHSEEELSAKLAALDAEDEEIDGDELTSDADYEAELKELTRLAELKKAQDLKDERERLAHEREVDRQWVKVEKINAKSAVQGVKALSFFLETYRGHKYGNPHEAEAERELERSRERLIEEKRARLSKTHLRQVEKAWSKAKRLVKVGDDKAEAALNVFLKAYEGHPLGNPLTDEARRFFEESQAKREEELEASHRAKVERSWSKAKSVIERGDAKAERALQVFLEAFSDHPRGNPLAEEAERFLVESKAKRESEREAKHRAEVEREWAKLKPILTAKGKTAERAIKLFIKRYATHPRGNPLAETAQVALEANARGEDASGVSTISGNAGIKWLRIPSGSFVMGSNDGSSDERPIHTVSVKSFLMSETEVTVGQYRKCVEAGRCTEPEGGGSCTWGKSGKEDHPINCVDWGQARTFAVWAGGDLPTEVQWEYAARGGENYEYAGSNNANEVAWYDSNSGGSTHSVKTKKKNGYGLYDMSGNVWEWTLDEWHSDYDGAPNQAETPWGDVGKCVQMCDNGSSRRVGRGGSWCSYAMKLSGGGSQQQRPRRSRRLPRLPYPQDVPLNS